MNLLDGDESFLLTVFTLHFRFCNFQRVLPHGQSHLFRSQSGQSDCVSDDEETCPGCCFNRRQKRATDPAPAESNPYYHSHHSCAHCSSSIRSADNASNEAENAQKRNCGCSTDALVLSEEGSNASSEYAAIICPICLEQLLVGEPVAWSKIGYCRHFFHYDCILRWAVLGNVTCPVCREEFWSRNALQTCILCHHDAIGKDNYQSFGLGGRPSAQEMRQSTFCVRHGLVSPSRRMVNEGGS